VTISSRTPEGEPGKCPICGHAEKIDPSTMPRRDAPCPSCGHLLSFEVPVLDINEVFSYWEERRLEWEAKHLPPDEPHVPEPAGPTIALALQAIDDPAEVRQAEDLFWQQSE